MPALFAVILCSGFLVIVWDGVPGGEAFVYGGLILIGLGSGFFLAANAV